MGIPFQRVKTYARKQFYYRTKIVRAKDMDFSEAHYFDEEERLDALAEQEKEDDPNHSGTWLKRARYLIFG